MNDSELKMHILKTEKQDKVKEATNTLVDALNTMGFEDEVAEAFFDAVTHSHRTLQANLVRMIGKFLDRYGKEASSDGRNVAAVEFAKAATEGAKGIGIPFI